MDEYKIKVKQLQYQSLHRGCKELDLLLAPFAYELPTLSFEGLLLYEEMLLLEDPELYRSIMEGRNAVARLIYTAFMAKSEQQ